jgi:hypothetical protein
MKSLLALAAVVAALALAAPAGARPIVDPPVTASPPTAVAPPADASDGASFLVVVLVGAAAFFTGAGAARLVRVPRRQSA